MAAKLFSACDYLSLLAARSAKWLWCQFWLFPPALSVDELKPSTGNRPKSNCIVSFRFVESRIALFRVVLCSVCLEDYPWTLANSRVHLSPLKYFKVLEIGAHLVCKCKRQRGYGLLYHATMWKLKQFRTTSKRHLQLSPSVSTSLKVRFPKWSVVLQMPIACLNRTFFTLFALVHWIAKPSMLHNQRSSRHPNPSWRADVMPKYYVSKASPRVAHCK